VCNVSVVFRYNVVVNCELTAQFSSVLSLRCECAFSLLIEYMLCFYKITGKDSFRLHSEFVIAVKITADHSLDVM